MSPGAPGADARSASIGGRGAQGRGRLWLRRLLPVVLAAYLGSAVWQAYKPLPTGVSVAMPLRAVVDVAVLADHTWTAPDGTRHSEQAIFDELLRLIAQARRLVVLDQFLFNDFGGGGAGHRPLSAELTRALIARRQAVPGLRVVLITDPVNTVYGGLASDHLRRLEQAGVVVVVTDLARLRASNPAWSGLWHLCCAWAGNRADRGWLPSPFGDAQVSLRSWLALLNFRANHRKTLVVDQDQDWVGLVGSGNPHDASSRHGNIAVRFSGAAALDLLATELAVAALSGQPLPDLPGPMPATAGDQTGAARLQVLTEGRIGAALMAAVDGTGAGDSIAVDVFYFAHRPLLHRLIAAHGRGATLRILLDPNRDAFGRVKGGIPNRQVGAELDRAGVPVRWCDTRGEQCHSKLMLVESAGGQAELIAGSANFTRRNLDDLNLETSVRLLASTGHPAIVQARAHFDRRWYNSGGQSFSLDFSAYAEHDALKRWRYRIGEATGLSTW